MRPNNMRPRLKSNELTGRGWNLLGCKNRTPAKNEISFAGSGNQREPEKIKIKKRTKRGGANSGEAGVQASKLLVT